MDATDRNLPPKNYVDSNVAPSYYPDWNRLAKSGDYLAVYCPDHPSAWPNGYVLAHRVVAEQKLGRLLLSTEVVHHKNHDKRDNRQENLEVLTNSDHSRHHANEHPQTMVPLTCAECGKHFSRRKGNDPAAKGSARAYCSRRCNGVFQRKVQMQSEATQ